MGTNLTGAGKEERVTEGLILGAVRSLEQRGSTLNERSLNAKQGFVIVDYLATVLVMRCMKCCVRPVRNKYV